MLLPWLILVRSNWVAPLAMRNTEGAHGISLLETHFLPVWSWSVTVLTVIPFPALHAPVSSLVGWCAVLLVGRMSPVGVLASPLDPRDFVRMHVPVVIAPSLLKSSPDLLGVEPRGWYARIHRLC